MGIASGRFIGRALSKAGSSKVRASVKAAVPFLSFFALAACALHPVQQNVTGLPVVDIVNHIRCETRLAIQNKAIQKLRVGGYADLAGRLELILGKSWHVNPYTDFVNSRERDFYYRYIQTGIAYNFTFDITEDNKAALAADPVRLITNGTVGIGLTSSGEFSRENVRTFIVSETFASLLQNVIRGCEDSPQPSENFAYPVAGSIGMAEMISTFIDLNEGDPLTPSSSGSSAQSKASAGTASPGSSGAPSKGSPGTSSNGSGVFADTLSFTTTLIGGVTPSVQINPIRSKFGLSTPTNFGATVTRTDKHMLSIGLSLATSADNTKLVAVASNPIVQTSGSQARSALQKSLGRITSPAEQRALDAVQQQRIDNFLNRFGTLTPTP